jgi:hypothetical protein
LGAGAAVGFVEGAVDVGATGAGAALELGAGRAADGAGAGVVLAGVTGWARIC